MDKILTVGDMKKFLTKFPDDMPIMTEKFVQRWSGNDDDTDLSGYEMTQIGQIRKKSWGVAWAIDDPRRKDKRRTCFGDSHECLVIEASS